MTTFSTFSLETLTMLQNGQIVLALTYIMVSAAACTLAVWIGMQMLS